MYSTKSDDHIRDFVDAYDITISSVSVADNPTMENKGDRWYQAADHWKCVLKNPENGEKFTTYFSMGSGNNGREPDVYDVLSAVSSSASSYGYTLEEFADDFGYDIDDPTERRRINKIYKAVQKEGEKLKKFLTDEQYQWLVYGQEPEDVEAEGKSYRAKAYDDYLAGDPDDPYVDMDKYMDAIAAVIAAKTGLKETSGRGDEYVGFMKNGKTAWGEWEAYLYIDADNFTEEADEFIVNMEFSAYVNVKPEWSLEDIEGIINSADEEYRANGGWQGADSNHHDGYPENIEDVEKVVIDTYGIGEQLYFNTPYDAQEAGSKIAKEFSDEIDQCIADISRILP